MFAVVHTGGNQARVEVGDCSPGHRDGSVGDEITFDRVLLLKDDSGIRGLGHSMVPPSRRSSYVKTQGPRRAQDPLMGKILVVKRKRRKKYRRIGFRALYTQIRITEIAS